MRKEKSVQDAIATGRKASNGTESPKRSNATGTARLLRFALDDADLRSSGAPANRPLGNAPLGCIHGSRSLSERLPKVLLRIATGEVLLERDHNESTRQIGNGVFMYV